MLQISSNNEGKPILTPHIHTTDESTPIEMNYVYSKSQIQTDKNQEFCKILSQNFGSDKSLTIFVMGSMEPDDPTLIETLTKAVLKLPQIKRAGVIEFPKNLVPVDLVQTTSISKATLGISDW